MNAVVPELLVNDLQVSLYFWCELLDFEIHYDRPDNLFSYLRRDDAEFMLEQIDGGARQWRSGALEKPLGRGINFQITLREIQTTVDKLAEAAWPLYLPPEEKWYRRGAREFGQRQFLVQDPDGYLLRLCSSVGQRAIT